MKSRFLFPHWFKLFGWLITVPGFVLGYLNRYSNFEIPGFGLLLREKATLFLPRYENFTNELSLTCIVLGLIFIAFSKQKAEDELTAKMRLNALYWAILINYTWYGALICLALISTILKIGIITAIVGFAGNNFAYMVYNLFLPLVIFLIRFYYLLYKSRDEYEIKPIKFLPNKPYRAIGKLLTTLTAAAALIALVIMKDDDFASVPFCILPLVMLLWVYSKEREEDEYINSVRMDAMQIAVYANYAVLLLLNLLVYGVGFLFVMIINLSTIPIIFLLVFHYRLYKIRQADNDTRKTDLTLNLL